MDHEILDAMTLDPSHRSLQKFMNIVDVLERKVLNGPYTEAGGTIQLLLGLEINS